VASRCRNTDSGAGDRRPFPVVLVHGGGGQGTDWMETPDGRPGWFQTRCRRLQGLRRRSPGTDARRSPRFHGAFPANPSRSSLAGRFTPPAANPANVPNEYRRTTSGGAAVGSPRSDQLVAGLGGSYVQRLRRRAPPVAGWGRGRRVRAAPVDAGAPAGPAAAVNAGPAGRSAYGIWRGAAGADLLDKIGRRSSRPTGGRPFGLLVAEARPNLVKRR
jgi:hypothetical protein